MSHFVEDLIPVILDSIERWWDRDFARLALVSPAWLYHVRKRLYTSPSLHSFSACASLAQTLNADPYLTSLVRNLTLRPCTDTSRASPSPEARMAVRTLLGLNNLQSLVLGGDLANQSERFLGFVAAADTLTQLHIDGTLLRRSLTSRASISWSEDLVFRFPNLKRLKFTEIELDIDPIFTSHPVQMDELVLDNARIISGFLSYLLPEDSIIGSLRVRGSSASDYDEHIRTMLHSSNVHGLDYEVRKSLPSDGSFLEPEGVPDPRPLCLKRLELHDLHVDTGVLALVDQWCPELEELIVSGRSISLSAQDWGEYIASGAMHSLRCLTLTWGTNHPPYQPWCADAVVSVTKATSPRRIQLFRF